MKKFIITLILLTVILSSCEKASQDSTQMTDSSKDTASETETLGETDFYEETITESTDSEIETEPIQDSYFVTDRGVTYRVFENYAEIYEINKSNTEALIRLDVDGRRVKSMKEGVFDFVEDPKNFAIYAYYGTFLYDYAVENGFTFFEIQNPGSDFYTPRHYFPEGADTKEWHVNETEVPDDFIHIARDDDEEIDRLVKEYLKDGSGYDELVERVMHRFACANKLAYMHDDVFEPYYISDSGDWHGPYTIYYPYEHNTLGYNVINYERVKYGKIETYSEFVENAKRIYTEDFVNRYIINIYDDEPWIKSCNDQIYTICGGAGSPPLDEFEYSMLVDENVILIHITCYEYYDGERGTFHNLNYVFTRFDEGWRFDSRDDMMQGYGQFFYNLFVGKIS